MTNTVNQIQIVDPTSAVVVQTAFQAAGWTAIQTGIATFGTGAVPVIAIIQADLADGPPFDGTNVVLVGWVALSALAAGIGAGIPLLKNHFKKTLPAGTTVPAQIKP